MIACPTAGEEAEEHKSILRTLSFPLFHTSQALFSGSSRFSWEVYGSTKS